MGVYLLTVSTGATLVSFLLSTGVLYLWPEDWSAVGEVVWARVGCNVPFCDPGWRIDRGNRRVLFHSKTATTRVTVVSSDCTQNPSLGRGIVAAHLSLHYLSPFAARFRFPY